MSNGGGLKQQLGLEDPKAPPSDLQAQQFSADFKSRMAGIGASLGATATLAPESKHAPLDSRRNNTLQAYQQVMGRIDPRDPSKASAAIDKVLGAADSLEKDAKGLRQESAKALEEWQAMEDSYLEAQGRIEELECAGEKKAGAFLKVVENIDAKVRERTWDKAKTTCEQLIEKLDIVYQEFQAQKAAQEAVGEAGPAADEAAGDVAGPAAAAEAAKKPGDEAPPAAAPKPPEAVPGDTDKPAPDDVAAGKDAKVAAKATDEEKWKAALEAFKTRLAALEKHAKAGANPEIKPKIDAIKTERDAAVAKATAGDFKAAVKRISPLSKKCDQTEDLAHAFAHYSEMLAHRQGLVNPNVGVNTGIADVDKLQRQIEGLLTKAQADAAAGKFKDGVKKLDQIPPLHQKMQVTDSKEGDYQGTVADHDPRLAALEALPAKVRAPYKKQIAAFKKTYNGGKYNKTKDYVVSMQIIGPMWRELGFLERMTAAAQSYLTALAPFETQLKAFEAHKGREGIEEFLLGMKGDYERAKADAADGKHANATALLNRTTSRWPAQTQIADDCLAYKTKREAVAKVIEGVRKNPAAATVLQQADALMATAASQALAKDFKAALASVTEAEQRANDAKAAAAAQDELGKLKDEGALGKIEKDFDAAYKVFTDMKAHVVSKDTGSDFTKLIATADVEAKKAQDEKAKASPDFAAARGYLDAAIAILEGALTKILAHGPFQTHLATAKTLVDTTLPPLSVDDCIKPAITAAKKLVTDAEALAKPDGYDFGGAEAKLGEAMKIGRAAEANAALWPAIKADKATTKAAADAIAAEPTVVPLMTARTTRLNAIMADIDKLVAAGDFKGAAEKGKEGAGLGPPTTADIAECKRILDRKKKWVDDRIGQIQGAGKEPAADALAETNSKLTNYQAMLNDANFAGASSILNEIYWSIQRGIDAIAAHGTYEPARAIAETKIKSVNAIRNAAVEQAIAAIEKRYAAAVAEAAKSNYFTAEREVKAIAPECDELLVMATAFKTYDDARAPAEAKLVEAEAHAQAEAIKTILVRLRGKYDNAVTLATGGDPATAQKMMEEILPAAEEAIKSADGSAIFARITETIADTASDDGPSFVHIAAAKKAYEWQAGKANASVAKAQLDEAKAELAKAESSATPPGDAKAALKAAMDAVTRAGEILSQHQLLTEAVAAAKAKIAELNAHAQKSYIAAKTSELETAVDGVVKLAEDGTNLDQASADLEAAMSGYHDIKAKADAQVKYLDLRAKPEVEPRLDDLERHDHSYAIQTQIDAMRKKLAEAAEKSKALEPEAAVALLEEVQALGISALVLADMRDNTPPSVVGRRSDPEAARRTGRAGRHDRRSGARCPPYRAARRLRGAFRLRPRQFLQRGEEPGRDLRKSDSGRRARSSQHQAVLRNHVRLARRRYGGQRQHAHVHHDRVGSGVLVQQHEKGRGHARRRRRHERRLFLRAGVPGRRGRG